MKMRYYLNGILIHEEQIPSVKDGKARLEGLMGKKRFEKMSKTPTKSQWSETKGTHFGRIEIVDDKEKIVDDKEIIGIGR